MLLQFRAIEGKEIIAAKVGFRGFRKILLRVGECVGFLFVSVVTQHRFVTAANTRPLERGFDQGVIEPSTW